MVSSDSCHSRESSEACELIQALLWNYGTTLKNSAPDEFGDIAESLDRLDIRRVSQPLEQKGQRPRVLFLGPGTYAPGVWSTRAKYIFPDLFGPLSELADIHMVTSAVPEFAKKGMRTLTREFGVKVIESRLGNPRAWLHSTLSAAKDVRPDVLTNIFAGVSMLYAAGMAGRLAGVKSVLRIAGDEIATRLAVGTYEAGSAKHAQDKFLEDIGLNLADRIIVMSDQERARIKSRLVVDRDQTDVVVRGVDLTAFKPATGIGKSKAPRKFCYVGRKSLEKGYDLIEQAARIVASEMPDIEFHFAGTFEPGRQGNAVYHGFVEAEDLPKFYGESDAFVLCSRNEGFPQALAEAMAMAKPCIVSRHLFETSFADGEDALLVDATAESVAKAVLRLARDAELSARLAARSRSIAETSLDRAGQRQAYRQIILDR
jgi:glycosyltransferase involved in cell wall biosynthesis